jgi:twinkle protein
MALQAALSAVAAISERAFRMGEFVITQWIKDEDLAPYMEERKAKYAVNPASTWTEKCIDHFYKPDDTPKIYLPWVKTHNAFHLRPAEVSLWAGINSHGKSQVVGQAMLGLAEQGRRVAIASLEMWPQVTMARMQCQAWGAELPSIDFIRRFQKWTDGRLWLYDHKGSVKPDTMIAVIRYSVEKFGIEDFVVDNLSKVIEGDQGERVYNAQKDFVNKLCQVANETGVHIHLVHHIRKGDNETDVPGKMDVKGSGAVTDLIDNVFIVWRNKEKEAAVRADDASLRDAPDAILKIDKQRNDGTEGSFHLWFDRNSFQYMESPFATPRRMNFESGVSLDAIDF